VLHLAACARAWTRHRDEFAAVNVQAVTMLLEAAQNAGVERLVHVSTVLTLPGLRPVPGRPRTPYEETKLIGERLVDAYAATGRHAVVVHPTRVYGPGPLNDANGVTRLVALYLDGPLVPRLDDGDVLANYAHAADVAAGILLAADRGRSGAHYVLGGENCSLGGLLRLVGELSGIRRQVVAIPRPAALAAAHAAVLWGRLGGSAPITPTWVRSYFEDQRVDVAPTCRALGYRYRPLRQGLQETITWLRDRLPAAS
jgi:farnesol dehydrogenase